MSVESKETKQFLQEPLLGLPKEAKMLHRDSSHWSQTVLPFVSVLVYLVVVALAYMFTEGWSFMEALYFVVITLTTIGYGDKTPSQEGTKILTVIFVLCNLVLISGLLSSGIAGLLESQEAFVLELAKADSEQEMNLERQKSIEKQYWMRVKVVVPSCIALVISYLILGSIFFYLNEPGSVLDSIYLTVITLSTVGYGDFAPTGNTSHAFAVFYVLSGVNVVAYAVARCLSLYANYYQVKSRVNLLNKSWNLKELQQMDEDHDGEVDWSEFAMQMVIKGGYVPEEILMDWKAEFKHMSMIHGANQNSIDVRRPSSTTTGQTTAYSTDSYRSVYSLP